MKKVLYRLTVVFVVSFFITTLLYIKSKSAFCFSLSITFMTTSYHFVMRLIVGQCVDSIMHNQANYYHKWFQVGKAETELYEMLKVSKWKDFMPTYSPETFSLKHHSFEEIAMSMCQSEIVHEVIAVLSLVPILFIYWFGQPAVFILTSILACCFDMMFVMMQRYNRPRIIKLIEKRKTRKQ